MPRPALAVARPLRLVAACVTSLALLAPLAGCGDGNEPTEPSTGSLVVPPVSGLPTGITATVGITGPNAPIVYNVPQDGRPDTLDALPPGTYTVTANDVVAGGVRWSPQPRTQSISVRNGVRIAAQPITYAISSGSLDLQVVGLPALAVPVIRLSAPGVTTRTLNGSTVVQPLDPGTYTLEAPDVEANGRTWRAGVSTQQVTIGAADSVLAVVDYNTGSASLTITVTGMPDGVDAGVGVTGPDGYLRHVRATTTLRNLEPGTYTVASSTIPGSLARYTPGTATQERTLATGGSAEATVAFTATPLVLAQQLVVEGLQSPVYLTAPAGDARLFVVERAGRIRIVKDGALLATPFLDITSRVNFTGERGLLGIAFDPQYATNGQFFAYYVDASSNLALERFTSTPGSDVAGPSAGLVLQIPHGRSEHHGGQLAFGPDGMLYLAPGDGGCCGDPRDQAQDMSSLLGKVLRIDIRGTPYTVPPDNPFVGRAGMRPEIWASGLRSPWRFSFDTPAGGTARFYLADVGQDEREEVNVIHVNAAGRNFGWPIMEGTRCYRPSTGCSTAGLTLPVLDYSHADGCSVTGGYVYRGLAMPELDGHYLYADFCRGWVRSVRVTGSLQAPSATEARTWPALSVPFIVSFGRDGLGELYMVANGGRIWRIVRG